MIVRYDIQPSGYFAAQAAQVGATDEEIAASANSEIPQERINAIAGRLRLAASQLNATEPLGRG